MRTANLTLKQDAFARQVAAGAALSEAYRTAYSSTEMQAQNVWPEASRLAKHPKVAARIGQLKAEAEEMRRMAALDREEAILNRLEHEATTARTDGARVRALELLGKHLGMFTDRVVVEAPQRTEEEVECAIVARLARYGLVSAT